MSCSCKKSNQNNNEKVITKEVEIKNKSINASKTLLEELLDEDKKSINNTNSHKEIVRSK